VYDVKIIEDGIEYNIKVNEQKIFNDYNECLKNNNEDFCKDFYTSPYKTD
jgi:hypothetical protein